MKNHTDKIIISAVITFVGALVISVASHQGLINTDIPTILGIQDSAVSAEE